MVCRSFMWSGQAFTHKPGAVAWEDLCWSKSCGGWGFRNVELWNVACLGKYVWAIASKQDNVRINGCIQFILKGEIGGVTHPN